MWFIFKYKNSHRFVIELTGEETLEDAKFILNTVYKIPFNTTFTVGRIPLNNQTQTFESIVKENNLDASQPIIATMHFSDFVKAQQRQEESVPIGQSRAISIQNGRKAGHGNLSRTSTSEPSNSSSTIEKTHTQINPSKLQPANYAEEQKAAARAEYNKLSSKEKKEIDKLKKELSNTDESSIISTYIACNKDIKQTKATLQ